MSKVTAVVGGQYGSEGKGVIVAHIAQEYDVHVRVGGPNAGHSFYYKNEKHVMQTIPCGWINPESKVYIGSGGMIDIEGLRQEYAVIHECDPTIRDRLFISPRAGILSPEHKDREGGIHGEMHARIGSTGKGVGAARLDRMARKSFKHAADLAEEEVAPGVKLKDFFVKVPFWLPNEVYHGKSVLLEGTQGFGLSLIHGPWPYVTSSDISAAQLCSDAGISPLVLTDVLLVVRTYPIRVAGTSGPMESEFTWEEISRRMGRSVEERTTVTKKVRRIGAWDEALVRDAFSVNRPTAVACTFMDYLDPEVEGKKDAESLNQSPKSKAFIDYLETTFKTRVRYVGTGGPQWSVIDR